MRYIQHYDSDNNRMADTVDLTLDEYRAMQECVEAVRLIDKHKLIVYPGYRDQWVASVNGCDCRADTLLAACRLAAGEDGEK